jgi:hypothetical protein
MEARMETTIPAELLELKSHFDQWRKTRSYNREPVPNNLRQAAVEIGRRYPRALVRQVLKIDPWRFDQGASTKKPARRNQSQTTFFQLPASGRLPELNASSPKTVDCRLQFERSDGSRLTLILPQLDLASINRLAADFLQGNKQ